MAANHEKLAQNYQEGMSFESFSTTENKTPSEFSKEALDFLKRKGNVVYSLDQLSLSDQILAGRPFGLIEGDIALKDARSMSGQVAFNPAYKKFFLEKSGSCDFSSQQEIINEYSYDLQKEFGSGEISAVMGDAPDYTQIHFLHLKATKGKVHLFRTNDSPFANETYRYAQTRTVLSDGNHALVGSHNFYVNWDSAPNKLVVASRKHIPYGINVVYAVPLIVPTSYIKK